MLPSITWMDYVNVLRCYYVFLHMMDLYWWYLDREQTADDVTLISVMPCDYLRIEGYLYRPTLWWYKDYWCDVLTDRPWMWYYCPITCCFVLTNTYWKDAPFKRYMVMLYDVTDTYLRMSPDEWCAMDILMDTYKELGYKDIHLKLHRKLEWWPCDVTYIGWKYDLLV